MTINPHIGEGADGTVMRIAANIDTSIVVVPITRIENYKFNSELIGIKKAVILDYVEYGYDFNLEESGTHLFGLNTHLFNQFQGEEWEKFDNWVKGLDEVVYFKREMLSNTELDNVFPLDYPCWFSVPEPVSQDEYNARKLNVFSFWGRSHEARLTLHGEIWKNARLKGYNVCDNIYFLESFLQVENGNNWATFNMPHYARVEMIQILGLNGLSKISIAMPGAGRKTFRGTGESPFNSALCMWEDNLKYSYEWVDGVNCIKFKELGKEIDAIEEAISNPQLYEIYLKSVQNCRNYQMDNYFKNYIKPKIEHLA